MKSLTLVIFLIVTILLTFAAAQYRVYMKNSMPRIGRTFEISLDDKPTIENDNYEIENVLDKEILRRIKKLWFKSQFNRK